MAKIIGNIESTANQGGADIGSGLLGGIFQIRGWELHEADSESSIEVLCDGQPAQSWTERYPRADIDAAYPDMRGRNPLPGFRITANSISFTNGPHSVSCVANCGQETAVLLTREVVIANGPEFAVYTHAQVNPHVQRTLSKLRKLVDVLQCPRCSSSMVLRSESGISCSRCSSVFQVRDFAAVMVGEAPEYPIEESALASPASNNLYPGPILKKLQEVISKGGLALDVGSGRRSFGFPELVQVEICAYPHTDVINQSDTLPFRDSSFDFVFALAVTEHVRRPWVLASEMQRVLKKGGSIHVDSAFLQPIHGYPSHYYNMTGVALQGLFDQIDVTYLKPELYQHPWFALNWILDHAVADISSDLKQTLTGMKFEDVLRALNTYVSTQTGIFAEISLPSERVDELAAGFTLMGTKRAVNGKSSHVTASNTSRLREIVDRLNYPDADIMVRAGRLSILLAHYRYWAKVHLREEGFRSTLKRALARLRGGLTTSN